MAFKILRCCNSLTHLIEASPALQVFPTNGSKSTSLWDAPDVASLQEWLDEFLDADCNSEVFQALDSATLTIFCCDALLLVRQSVRAG